MEPAKIDWNNIESKFVEDDLYEHINAPKWIDLSSPEEESVDDEAWFCKPDCRHPKTVEDFIRSTPPSKVKYLRSATISEILPLRNRNIRDGNMKRGGILSSLPTNDKRLNKSKTFKPPDKFQEDQENENPNNSTSLNHHQVTTLKSMPEKRKPFDKSVPEASQEERKPKLKSTLSGSNLFAGKEIMSHITEFCSELKKLVMRAKERSPKKKLSEGSSDDSLGELDEKEKEIKPLLVEKENSEMLKSSEKENKKKLLKTNDMENILVPNKVTGNGQEGSLLQVRTCPPSPQCFSGYREPPRRAKATTNPLRASKSILSEKKLQGVEEPNNRVETSAEKAKNKNISIAGKEGGRSLEMFWSLKPCTLLDS